jgi:hypothetical protein
MIVAPELLDPVDRIARAMAKTFWPFHWATVNDETQAELIKYAKAAVEEIAPELAEVDHLRGTVDRLQVEKHDLVERLLQVGSSLP